MRLPRAVRRGLLAATTLAVVGMVVLAVWFWSAIATIAPRTGLGDVLAPIDGAVPAPGSVAWKVRRGTASPCCCWQKAAPTRRRLS